MDIMDNIQSFDTAVLLSGDSDFAPIVKRMKERGKKLVVMSAKRHVSRELIQLANRYINLKKLRDRIELTTKSPR